ncbi:DUF4129 domain-containing protein [Cellulomonas composti]|uniref:Membrane protein n=1 Tax=Cellulomonas composti TaxID=266130 RepID=A0A511JAW7_9CELL|nr:DUF4129 domain-containing protein [Cellulomonas composti]GEL95140.1 membrane protein [Cellulomonas composti]
MSLFALPVGALTSEVPVTPDAQEARRAAIEELSRPVYHQQRSLLSRLFDWLGDRLDEVSQSVAITTPVTLLIVAVVVLGAALVAYWVAGPVRRSRSRGQVAGVHDSDDIRTAAQLRAAADAAADAGEWSAAVRERFRAIVRSLEERAVLDERPGRTAHEASLDAAPAFPALVGDLAAGGRLFDDVVYGERSAGPADDDALRRLDAALVATVPNRTRGLVEPVAAVPR